MADKRGESAPRALGTAAAFGAAFAARKLITLGWKRATGKEPPIDPQDPEVSTAEALGWAIIMGVMIGTVRVLAIRGASGLLRRDGGRSATG